MKQGLCIVVVWAVWRIVWRLGLLAGLFYGFIEFTRTITHIPL